MGRFTKLPLEIEAMQFTGDNWDEMHAFTGHAKLNDWADPVDVFIPQAYDLDIPHLWVEANKSWLPIEVSEWVAKDGLGFYPIKDVQFQKSYILSEDYAMVNPDIYSDQIPTLDADAEDARVVGRIRMALLMTRPQSEVDVICDRVVQWCAKNHIISASSSQATMDKSLLLILDWLEEIGVDGDNYELAHKLIKTLLTSKIAFIQAP